MKLVKLFLGLFCATLVLATSIQLASADSCRAVINGRSYSVQLANNQTSKAFAQRMPLTLKMHELNGNEKYHYLHSKLPSNDHQVHQIHKGDVMLYQSRCIVVFYKNFKTNYAYTKIGHLQGLGNVGKSSVQVKWEHNN